MSDPTERGAAREARPAYPHPIFFLAYFPYWNEDGKVLWAEGADHPDMCIRKGAMLDECWITETGNTLVVEVPKALEDAPLLVFDGSWQDAKEHYDDLEEDEEDRDPDISWFVAGSWRVPTVADLQRAGFTDHAVPRPEPAAESSRLPEGAPSEQTTPCELCGAPTPMLGTKRCDRCWELESRIKRDPKLAQRILSAVRPEGGDGAARAGEEFEEVKCRLGDYCPYCDGEACAMCGANGSGQPDGSPCEHDAADRHLRPVPRAASQVVSEAPAPSDEEAAVMANRLEAIRSAINNADLDSASPRPPSAGQASSGPARYVVERCNRLLEVLQDETSEAAGNARAEIRIFRDTAASQFPRQWASSAALGPRMESEIRVLIRNVANAAIMDDGEEVAAERLLSAIHSLASTPRASEPWEFAQIARNLAEDLRKHLGERYSAFFHGGRGNVGLRLPSEHWRLIILALEHSAASGSVSQPAPSASDAPESAPMAKGLLDCPHCSAQFSSLHDAEAHVRITGHQMLAWSEQPASAERPRDNRRSQPASVAQSEAVRPPASDDATPVHARALWFDNLLRFAIERILATLSRDDEATAAWQEWARRWLRGERAPQDAVDAGRSVEQIPIIGHPLLQLAWAAKEAFYVNTKLAPWLVLRYVADAAIAFELAPPEKPTSELVTLPVPALVESAGDQRCECGHLLTYHRIATQTPGHQNCQFCTCGQFRAPPAVVGSATADPNPSDNSRPEFRALLKAIDEYGDALFLAGGEQIAEQNEAEIRSLQQRLADAEAERDAILDAGKALSANLDRIDHLESVIRWALGEEGEFPTRPDAVPGKPYPYFYWRRELRRRAALRGGASEP